MITAVVLAAVFAGVWLATNYRDDSRARLLPNRAMTLFPDPKPLTAFSLTDHQDRAFDLSRLKDRWTFIFFGFTHCPDICPTTLAVLARAREDIAKSAGGVNDVQFVFVSVDPNRDNLDTLRKYVTHFDSTFLGVTGDDVQIGNLARQLGAAYQVTLTPDKENYPVNHTAAVFLVDPRARYHAVLTPPLDAKAISSRFKLVRELAKAKTT